MPATVNSQPSLSPHATAVARRCRLLGAALSLALAGLLGGAQDGLALSTQGPPAETFRTPTRPELERTPDQPAAPIETRAQAPSLAGGPRARSEEAVPSITATLRVRSAEAHKRNRVILTRASFEVVGEAPGLEPGFELELPGGRVGETVAQSTAYPLLRRGMTVRARFVLWHGRFTLVSAEPSGDGDARASGVSAQAYTTYGAPFRVERIPVYWRTQPGLSGWATDAIARAWSMWRNDPSSYMQDTRTRDGGAPAIGSCGTGSWIVFRELPPGIVGQALYCSDAQGRSELQIEMKPFVDYNLTEALAHEIGHGAVALGHSNDRRDVMWPTVSSLSSLGPGDLSGLRAQYPGRVAFTLDGQSGIGSAGTSVAYPDRATIGFNLRARGESCDPGSMWLQPERPDLGRYLFEGYDERTGRVPLTRAPNDSSVCYARVNVGPRAQQDASPGLLRFSLSGPEGRLGALQPSTVLQFRPPRLADEIVSPSGEQAVGIGGSRTIDVRVRNRGRETWTRGKHNLHNTDSDGRDRAYPYCGQSPYPPEWMNGNAVRMREDRVPSGAVGTFAVKVCGQAGYQGSATLRLQMVAEGDAHFGPILSLPLRFTKGGPDDGSTDSERTSVRLFNGDDRQIVRLCRDGGSCEEIGRAGYRDERTLELGVLQDPDELELEVENGDGGYAWGLEVDTGSETVYREVAGEAGKDGANGNDQAHPNQTVFHVRVDRRGEILEGPDQVARKRDQRTGEQSHADGRP